MAAGGAAIVVIEGKPARTPRAWQRVTFPLRTLMQLGAWQLVALRQPRRLRSQRARGVCSECRTPHLIRLDGLARKFLEKDSVLAVLHNVEIVARLQHAAEAPTRPGQSANTRRSKRQHAPV
eukprot:607603-Prymnesium_polylepis.2